jgi:hypothetical protein
MPSVMPVALPSLFNRTAGLQFDKSSKELSGPVRFT